jgi:hypothetical protein
MAASFIGPVGVPVAGRRQEVFFSKDIEISTTRLKK